MKHKYLLIIFTTLSLFLLSCADDGGEEDGSEKTDAEYAAEYLETHQVICADTLVYHSGSENSAFPPEKAFGPPLGQGQNAGSLDVFVVGEGQNAIFSFSSYSLSNGTGPDFKVFENGFLIAGTSSSYSWDLGWLEVSAGNGDPISDPDSWDWYLLHFQHDGDEDNAQILDSGKIGMVGMLPVITNYIHNPLDPRLDESGGDAFDLDDALHIDNRADGNPMNFILGNSLSEDGISSIRYVRIYDGDSFLPDGQDFSNGVDIDAICSWSYTKN